MLIVHFEAPCRQEEDARIGGKEECALSCFIVSPKLRARFQELLELRLRRRAVAGVVGHGHVVLRAADVGSEVLAGRFGLIVVGIVVGGEDGARSVFIAPGKVRARLHIMGTAQVAAEP